MYHSQVFVDTNSAISSSLSSPSSETINYLVKSDSDSEQIISPQTLTADHGLTNFDISSEKASLPRKLIPLEKKRCCSCGTSVTPVWRRHSCSSVMNLESSLLTFDPYHNNEQIIDNNYPNCQKYSTQRKYLCNACGIKYKKLHSSPIMPSRSQSKRKSLDYSFKIKPPTTGNLNFWDSPDEKPISQPIPILPIKQIKSMPKVRRPSTSFIFFCREYRKSLTKQNPSCSFGQISKILGDMWASLPETNKQIYIARGQQDEYRYAIEKQAMLSNRIGSLSINNQESMIANVSLLNGLVPITALQEQPLGYATSSDPLLSSIFISSSSNDSFASHQATAQMNSNQDLLLCNPYSYIQCDAANSSYYPSPQQMISTSQYNLLSGHTYFNANTTPLECSSKNQLFLNFPYLHTPDYSSLLELKD